MKMEAKYTTGDIIICRGHSSLSQMIMKATKSNYSHTAQFIWIDNVLYVFDAQSNGSGLRKFEYWDSIYKYDFEVYRPKSIMGNYVDFMLQFSGVPYDKKGLAVGLFKSLLIKLLKRKDMADKYRNNGLFWCSELTMKPYVTNPEDYTPQKVYDFCIENNFELINLAKK